MEESDETLVIRAQAGEDGAFDTLITRYRNRICAVIFHMLWNKQEAEDLAQEVFVRAYRNLGKFRREAKFFTWLYRIAVNTTYTLSRRAARIRKAGERAAREKRHRQEREKSPEELLESGELHALVHTALQRLDPRFSQVLVMKEIENLEVADIARMLNLPEGTVKSRLFRAREALRSAVRDLEACCREDA